ncbi:MAG: surface-adhesin E family protein [Methylophilaceae bacterium]
MAADWVALPAIPNGDSYYYDKSKLVIKDDEITYWKKVQFKTPQAHNGSEVVSGILRERIHCGEHTAKLLTYLYYSAKGDTVDYVAQDESLASPIVPDTVGDKFDDVLCPMVWRKQEEVRIAAEQKSAELESKMGKEAPKAKEEVKPAAAVPVPNSTNNPPVRPAKSPIQKPVAPRANNIVPLKAIKPTTSETSEAPKLLPNVHLPDKVDKAPALPMPQLPEPQILEQLY